MHAGLVQPVKLCTSLHKHGSSSYKMLVLPPNSALDLFRRLVSASSFDELLIHPTSGSESVVWGVSALLEEFVMRTTLACGLLLSAPTMMVTLPDRRI